MHDDVDFIASQVKKTAAEYDKSIAEFLDATEEFCRDWVREIIAESYAPLYREHGPAKPDVIRETKNDIKTQLLDHLKGLVENGLPAEEIKRRLAMQDPSDMKMPPDHFMDVIQGIVERAGPALLTRNFIQLNMNDCHWHIVHGNHLARKTPIMGSGLEVPSHANFVNCWKKVASCAVLFREERDRLAEAKLQQSRVDAIKHWDEV